MIIFSTCLCAPLSFYKPALLIVFAVPALAADQKKKEAPAGSDHHVACCKFSTRAGIPTLGIVDRGWNLDS